ncbi:RNA methyltransferase [Lentilactobacillus diolivorans]|uniref:TrmH family RNA methyltransferase n=1 Tax=Lentilactobacillus diolivorans TaxID=179838 RepID=UPI002469C08E|nr:RNA methyltransferase [Lentilactobacillus diolivorans]MDH5104293.1 RNA methyltransferase [Lentilactobacillus diolivorans]
MQRITSNQNSRVKEWTKMQSKKGRVKSGQYVIEGWHIVDEAIKHHKQLQALMVTDETYLENLPVDSATEVYVITPEIAKHIAATETPQGVFAVLATEDYHETIPDDLDGSWLLLDSIQDPGNIGTMVRTADAAGMNGVVFGKGSADIYNPKVVRSMQGSQFHMRLFAGDLIDWMTAFKKNGVPTYGTELNDQAISYYDVQPTKKFGLVMGNEGNGVDPEILSWTSQNLYIPMNGEAESLNVAVATGILIFHFCK